MSKLNKIILTTSLALASCGSDDSNDILSNPIPDKVDLPDKVNLEGSAEKGMFIQGSDIEINLLDSSGNNLGFVYNSQTIDDLGNFSTTLAGLPETYTGNLFLSGEGFYFQEYAGKLSDAQQTLKTLYGANGTEEEIHINIVTHLSYGRAKNLLKQNSNLNASVSQAHNELVASLNSLGIIYPTGATEIGTDMHLFGGNTGANHYLLAVSCAFENTAHSSDSELQELLNKFQADLAGDGNISQDLADRVRKGIVSTDFSICVSNLQERAEELGVPFNLNEEGVMNLLDVDLDGIPDSQDPDFGDVFCKGNLCWERTPTTQFSPDLFFTELLDNYVDYCDDLVLDGNNDWRVPIVDELKTLIEGSCLDPQGCEVGEGPGKNGCYWNPLLNGECGKYISSDTYDPGSMTHSLVNFLRAKIDASESPPLYGRCVRDKD